MRHTIRVEQRTSVQDATGEPVVQWNLVAERACAIERTPGQEVWAAAGRNSRVPTVFKMRYDASVMASFAASETRAIFGGRVHDISSCFDPDGLKSEMTIVAHEHVEEKP